MAHMRGIDELDAAGKRVLVRVDFNVPLNGTTVTDDTRIRAALPTLEYLLDQGARVVVISHLGRPSSTGFEPEYSLFPAAQKLAELLGVSVTFAHDIVGQDAREKVAALQDGHVVVLENVRFDAREKKNDPAFCRELASLAEVYVNDAFGTAHRAHASTAGVAALLPSYAGFLMQREVATLTELLRHPNRPFVAILGGSKVSDKIKIIEALVDKCDTLIVGGAMCFTFLAAQGKAVGTSLVETDYISLARNMLKKAHCQGVKVLLPCDVVVADRLSADAKTLTVSVDDIAADMMGLDIGTLTQQAYAQQIKEAQTVFWNGPMGVFEMPAFEAGTRAVALALAQSKAFSVVGGGDSVAASHQFKVADKMDFISTGGGASMKLVEGQPLAGVEALKASQAQREK